MAMGVYLPCYCTREDVKTAADILQTADYNVHIDSAIQAAVDDIYGLCHRYFYNVDDTRSVDWPNYQYAYPWRIWLDASELADVTANVPVVTSGGTVIPNANIFWGNPRYSPPYTYLELNRSSTSTFGVGTTPQRDVAITGTFGYWTKSHPAGTLAAGINASVTSVAVSDASAVGVGETITVGSERMLVSDRSFSTTGQTQVSGCTTAQSNDVSLTVASGAALNVGEKILLDSEMMLITAIAGNVATVIRAYDGSVLATHSGATVYADRTLTVLRGQFGTTAAAHNNGDAATALIAPQQVRELAIAYSQVYVAQKTSAYARAIAEGTTAVPGQGIPALEARVKAAFGRNVRQRVI